MSVKPINIVLKISSVLMVLFLGLVCCKKKLEDPVTPELSSVKEISIADADLNSIFGDVDTFIDSGSIVPFGNPIRKDTSVNGYSKYIELNYNGSVYRNLSRIGTVKCFVSGSRKAGNFRDSVIFENTRINKRSIKGYFKTVQTQTAVTDSWTFDFSSKLIAENSNGNKIQFESIGTKTKTGIKTRGDSIIYKQDDIWNNSDTWLVQDSKGQLFSVRTTSPLVIKANCSYHYPVQGVQDFFNASQNINYRVKFGDGECDSYASYLNEKGIEHIFFIE